MYNLTAKYSYKAANQDELSFNKGDIVSVISEDDTGWWKGCLKGKVGFLPINYFEFHQDTTNLDDDTDEDDIDLPR